MLQLTLVGATDLLVEGFLAGRGPLLLAQVLGFPAPWFVDDPTVYWALLPTSTLCPTGGRSVSVDTSTGKLTVYTRQGLSVLAHSVHMMSSEKKRVQFRAPHRLIDRTDALADVLGEDRTDILVTALREYLQEAAHDDALTQEIAAAFYDDEISVDQLNALVGAEEAANLRVLKQQLDDDFIDEVADA